MKPAGRWQVLDELLGGKAERVPGLKKIYGWSLLVLGAVATAAVLMYVFQGTPRRGAGRIVVAVPVAFYLGYLSPYLLLVALGLLANIVLIVSKGDLSAWPAHLGLLVVMAAGLWRASAHLPSRYKRASGPAAPWWAVLTGAAMIGGVVATGWWYMYKQP